MNNPNTSASRLNYIEICLKNQFIFNTNLFPPDLIRIYHGN